MDNSKIDYIGELASDDDVRDLTGKDNSRRVFINNIGELQYSVKIISEPSPASGTLVTGYLNSIIGSIFEEEEYEQDAHDERTDKFSNYISNYLFILNYTEKNSYRRINRATLVGKPPSHCKSSRYVAVPVFQPRGETADWEADRGVKLYRDFETLEEFADTLEARKNTGRVENYSAEQNRIQMIFWLKDGNLTAVGPFDSCRVQARGYTLGFDRLFKAELDDADESFVYLPEYNPTLLHIDENDYDKLFGRLRSGDCDVLRDRQNLADGIESDVRAAADPADIDRAVLDRLAVLLSFRDACFPIGTLHHLHTAVKTGWFTVITGSSGSGKTLLADAYVKAAAGDLAPADNCLRINMNPSWPDDSPLLGCVDRDALLYWPGETGLLDLILDAQKAPERPFFVLLDDINAVSADMILTRLLGALGSVGGCRQVALYGPKLEQTLRNGSRYPYMLEIPDNVNFIATAFTGQGAHALSDRLLSVACVINLGCKACDAADDMAGDRFAPHLREMDGRDYTLLRETDEMLPAPVREMLAELSAVLTAASPGFRISRRTLRRMGIYLNAFTGDTTEGVNLTEALDRLLVSCVLTRIRGDEDQLSDLLSGSPDKGLIPRLDNFSALSGFKDCRETVLARKKELNTYGYCV